MLNLDDVLVADENSGLVEAGKYYLFPNMIRLETWADTNGLEIDEEGIYCLRIFLDDLIDRIHDGLDTYDIVEIVFGLYDDALNWSRVGYLDQHMFDLVREALIGAVA